jgi:hypothetical protein
MQVPNQGQGLIAEHEGIIKQHVNSNPTISLDHQISSIQILTTVVDPPTIAQLQLQILGDGINHTQVTILQSTLTIDGHPPIDIQLASVPLPTSSYYCRNQQWF